MVLDTTLPKTQHYKVRIKSKVEQSRERSNALPYTLLMFLSNTIFYTKLYVFKLLFLLIIFICSQLALHCHFRSNPTQRGYRKRMIEIWPECARFQTTSQTLADQVRTIIKKGWFSDLEIPEIYQKINNEQDSNTISDTPSINKQKQPNRNESPNSENRNNAQPNNP